MQISGDAAVARDDRPPPRDAANVDLTTNQQSSRMRFCGDILLEVLWLPGFPPRCLIAVGDS
ncbi:hypothetical protein CGMCC3_g8803 [Colletotrichum fructicola]|nr:uncharacterized protein CGMCC3_g8803 [Colletotrichum fructicola]KAE9575208.1 hypothetical protein CGMCC3_g8803 [Colletotrichum fructicola]